LTLIKLPQLTINWFE